MDNSFAGTVRRLGWSLPLSGALAVIVLAVTVLLVRTEVSAATQGSAGLTINNGNPVTVGTTTAYSLAIVNSSTSPEHIESVLLTSITAYPSCNTFELSSPLCATAGNQNAGTFTPGATGTGAAGTACAGATFTVTKAASGLWTFTPLAPATYPTLAPSSPGGPLATCVITGTVQVLALPADADAVAAGIQTDQLGRSEGATTTTQRPFLAFGTSAVTVVAIPDVKVEKTAGATPINAGANAVFNIVVTNLGPGSATGVTLSDTLPATAGVWTIGGPDAAACGLVGDVLTCNFGTIAQAGTKTISLTSPTVAADCKSLPNTATVAATNEDQTKLANNTSSATIVVNCPDVGIAKTGNGPINAGATATWTITVTNNGPSTATNVTVADTLPGTGWTDDSASCTVTPGANDVLSCTFASIAFPGTAVVHVSKTTTAANCPSMTNTATVSMTGDTNAANNSSTATIVVNCPPDVGIAKTGNGPINAGATATWTITVTNNGPLAATNVTVADTLPGTGWTDDSASCTVTPGANDVLSCTFASIAFPGTAVVHVSKTTTAANCPSMTNTATVSVTGDTNPANNSSTATIVVNCPPDVGIAKTGNGPINAGATATWTITVTNNGPLAATNVTVADTLPGTGWTDDSASCTVTPGANDVLSCTFASIAFPGTAVVHVSKTTTAANCGTLTNTATVSVTGDTNAANNSSTATIVVNCPDVGIAKTGNGPINAGATATWTITVTNNGPSTATNVTVADTLPGTGWTDDSASCTVTPGANDVLSCTFASIAFPGTAVVHVSKTTTAANCPSMTNTATVSMTGDTNAANNSSTATIVVNCPSGSRTIGYWSQHLDRTIAVWFGGQDPGGAKVWAGVSPTDTYVICGTRVINTPAELMGGFLASIPRTSTGDQRSALDQARMRLLQQLLGAILNNAAFGSTPSGSVSLADAKAAFCSTDISVVNAAASAMGAFNEAGTTSRGPSVSAKCGHRLSSPAPRRRPA